MPRLDQLLRDQHFELSQQPVAWSATIANAPAGVSSDVFVVIPAIDPMARVGPCPWTPRPTAGGVLLPAVGDFALVVFDETERPWITCWTPH